jgi:hypothetical protein
LLIGLNTFLKALGTTAAGIYVTFDNLKIAISPFIVGLTGFNSSTMSSLASLTG